MDQRWWDHALRSRNVIAVAAASLIRSRLASDISYNIKTDFGAVGDGVTDDSHAFSSCLDTISVHANDDKRVTVIYPPGKYYSPQFPFLYPYDTNPAILNWVRDITAQATGAEFTVSNFIWLAGGGPPQDNTTSGFFQTNQVGDSAVILIDETDASKFAVGNIICVAGLTLQNPSYPANFWVQEWKKITDIDGATVTLDSPLKHVYKDTWPTFNVSGIDCGAAKLIAPQQSYDMTVLINGFKFDAASQIYCSTRDCSYYNLTVEGEGTIAGGQKNYVANGCNFTNPSTTFEVDKMLESARFINCNFAGNFINQSSNETQSFYGTKVVNLFGTAKNTVIDKCDMQFVGTGPWYGGFGYSNNVTIKDSKIEYIGWSGPSEPLSDWVFNNGVFSRPLSAGPLSFGVPGAKMFLWDIGSNVIRNPAFRIIDITHDSATLYIHTALAAIPTYTGVLGQPTRWGPWGCDNLTVTNCTGLAGAAWSRQVAQGKSIGEYSNTTYSGNISRRVINTQVWGNLVSWKIDVERPYRGLQPNCRLYFNGANGTWISSPTFVISVYAPYVNCKEPGIRTITPVGVIGNRPGDGIPSLGNAWICGVTGVYLDCDMAADSPDATPIVNIEIILSQEND